MTLAKDTLYFDATSTTTSLPVKAKGRGYCFDCDHPVEMEHDQWWSEFYEPPKTCQECGGHDVEFMGRVAERLWERTQFNQRLEYSLKHHAEIFQRLADMELDTPSRGGERKG